MEIKTKKELNAFDLSDTIEELHRQFNSLSLLLETIEREYYYHGHLDINAAAELGAGRLNADDERYRIAERTSKISWEYPKFMGYLAIMTELVDKGIDFSNLDRLRSEQQ